MDGIKVTRLSGIKPGIDYRRIDGIGHVSNSAAALGREFDNLGCTCNSLGDCSVTNHAQQLLREFEQRVKNHLINTYNYIVKNRAKCGISNPDTIATAYRKIIDNWNDPTLREQTMSEAEKLIQNDDQIVRDFSQKMAAETGMRNAVLVKLRNKGVPTMPARRRAVVMNGLGLVGELDYEILPENTQALGTVIEDFSAMGLAGHSTDVTVALGSTLIPYSEVDLYGINPSDEVYVLHGTNKNGKKVKVKITPKNAVKKVKQAVKAVAKVANTAAQKTGAAAIKSVAKTKEVAKKAAKAIVKYNPVFVAGRNGFLLAAKLNIKNISRKLMWAYASLEQAKKAGFSQADWENSKKALRKTEEIFVNNAGGNANALRKAVLSSHAAKKAGLGDPATAAAIAAAMPLILAVVTALRDVKVAQAGGVPTMDPDGAQGDPIPGEGSANTEIQKSSSSSYQNISDNSAIDSQNSGNQSVYQDSESSGSSFVNSQVEQTTDNNATADSSNNAGNKTGLILGGLALGVVGLIAFSGSKTSGNKGLSGTTKQSKDNPKVIVEKFTIN